MKKLISLFLIVAMLSSFAIVANAETKVNLNVQWFATKTTFGQTSVNLESPLTEANPGDLIAMYFYTPASTYLSAIGFYVNYDESILTYSKVAMGTGWTGEAGDQGNGVLKVGAATANPSGDDYHNVAVLYFNVKQSPVKTKDALVSISIDTAANNKYNPAGGAEAGFTADEIAVNLNAFTGTALKINGVQEPVKEFKVTATDDGSKTVVKVENKGDKTGKVYVATFVGGVLDLCQVKDLADGDLTFEGLTGDVKVYVWDNNMVPLLDTALDA